MRINGAFSAPFPSKCFLDPPVDFAKTLDRRVLRFGWSSKIVGCDHRQRAVADEIDHFNHPIRSEGDGVGMERRLLI